MHCHAPDHDHTDPHAADTRRRLLLALAVTAVFMVVEFAGGLLTGSLALLADAGHMATDVAALALAVVAANLARRPASPRRTFGMLRMEVIGAFVNGATLVGIVVWIFYEALGRLGQEYTIDGPLMLGVAAVGLGANIVAAVVLHRGAAHSLNVRGAYLHVLGDLLGSLGALIAGFVIWTTGWTLVDPLVSMLIGLIILVGSLRLLRVSVNILLNAAPEDIDTEAVRAALESNPHVAEVHDLHIWSISAGNPSLSAHLRLHPECCDTAHWQECLRESQDMLRRSFGITHTTLQLEPTSYEKDSRRI